MTAGVEQDLLPLQREELAEPASSRKCGDYERPQVITRRRQQPLLLVCWQPTGALGLRTAVQANHVHAMPLARRVVTIALSDGPVEEVAHARFETVQRDQATLAAPPARNAARRRSLEISTCASFGRLVFSASSFLSAPQPLAMPRLRPRVARRPHRVLRV